MFHIRTASFGSVFAIVLAGLLAAAPAAQAADDSYDDIQTKLVSTHGLDLNSLAGRATLHRRIATAAASVCGSYDTRDLQAVSDYELCRAKAIAEASVRADVLIAGAGMGTMSVADAGASRP